MERSDRWKRRNSRITAFSVAASIDPKDERIKSFFEDMNAKHPKLKADASARSKLAMNIASAFNLNGAGLFSDSYLRKFLLEYNGRVLQGRGAFLPTSMNVIRAFLEPSAETYILELLEEEIYSFRFETILDFLTEPNVDRSLHSLTKLAEEFKVYEFNMFGAFAEFQLPATMISFSVDYHLSASTMSYRS